MDIAPGYVRITIKPGSLIKRKAKCHTAQKSIVFLGQFWANSIVKLFSSFGDVPGRRQRRKVAQSKAAGVKFFKKKRGFYVHGTFYSGFCKICFSKNFVRIDIKISLHIELFPYPGGSKLTPVAPDCATLRRWGRPGTSSKELNIFTTEFAQNWLKKTLFLASVAVCFSFYQRPRF